KLSSPYVRKPTEGKRRQWIRRFGCLVPALQPLRCDGRNGWRLAMMRQRLGLVLGALLAIGASAYPACADEPPCSSEACKLYQGGDRLQIAGTLTTVAGGLIVLAGAMVAGDANNDRLPFVRQFEGLTIMLASVPCFVIGPTLLVIGNNRMSQARQL